MSHNIIEEQNSMEQVTIDKGVKIKETTGGGDG